MKNLLNKEIRLAASPISWWFIGFGLMTMVPGYPILLGSFFVCFGLFQSFQQGRENNDVLYTVLLPVDKRDAVTARYLLCMLIQALGLLLMTLLTLVRMLCLSQAAPYLSNPLLNANPFFLAMSLLVMLSFNAVFIPGFYRTGWKLGRPLILFGIAVTVLITIAEVLHHIPGLEWLNSTTGEGQWGLPLIALPVYLLGSWLSCRRARKLFARVDL